MKIGHVDWLLNRIEELEKELNKQMNIGLKFEGEANELQKQNKRYREALKFYADEENYELSEIQISAITKESYKISRYKYDSKVNIDNGEKARQALKGE